MTTESNTHLISSLKFFSQSASAAVILVGCLVLVGWMLDIGTLKSVLPGLVTMKANTAFAFVLSGISLWLLRAPAAQADQSRKATRRLVQGCAATVALVGLLTLSEYLFGWDLGIDQLLFKEPLGAVGTFMPGRMAPNTALNFFLVGCALLTLDVETRRGHRPTQFLALTAALIGLVALTGYVYGVKSLYGIATYTQIALHTAVTFIALSIGILCVSPDRGLVALVTGDNAGSSMARRLVPAVIGVPLLLGWLRLKGQQAGLYDTELGVSLFVVSSIVVFGVVIWWSAESLNRTDAERKRAEETIKKLNEDLNRRAVELEAANKELEAFSYSVSHDLRAPLRAIDGFSRILLEKQASQLSPENQRYLRLTRDNAQQMGQLIDDLLTFSRLSRQPLKKQPLAPAEIIRQVLDDLRHEQGDGRAEVSVSDLPACEADPALLKQVWMNLLSNALKYTRKRDLARIEIGSQKDGREQIYYVRDNGVGFDMRYSDKLFGVFQRLHRAEEYEGTGVGLAIVHRIIHRHGGRVWAESELDKGTAFYFTLEGGRQNG